MYIMFNYISSNIYLYTLIYLHDLSMWSLVLLSTRHLIDLMFITSVYICSFDWIRNIVIWMKLSSPVARLCIVVNAHNSKVYSRVNFRQYIQLTDMAPHLTAHISSWVAVETIHMATSNVTARNTDCVSRLCKAPVYHCGISVYH